MNYPNLPKATIKNIVQAIVLGAIVATIIYKFQTSF